MRTLLLIVCLLLPMLTFAQTEDAIEKELLQQYEKMKYWLSYEEDNDKVNKYDSLEKANKQFQQKLLKYTSKNPATIKYKFRKLQEAGVAIATSEDALLRIYSWDDMQGGTMRFFDNVFQYKTNDKIISTGNKGDEHDDGILYPRIFTLDADGKTYYIATQYVIGSTKDRYEGVKIFAIENGVLNHNIRLIKTQTGMHNTLGFSYDFFTVMDNKELPEELISYNTGTKTLTIPVVSEHEAVTKRKITYQFTGKYLERIKEK